MKRKKSDGECKLLLALFAALFYSSITISGPISWMKEKRNDFKTWAGGRLIKRGGQAVKLRKEREEYKKKYGFWERVGHKKDTLKAKLGLGGSDVKIRHLERKLVETNSAIEKLQEQNIKNYFRKKRHGENTHNQKILELKRKADSLQNQIDLLKQSK